MWRAFLVALVALLATPLKASALNEALISVSDAAAVETDSGQSFLQFTVSATGLSGQDVSVGYRTLGGTAEGPGDFEPTDGRVVLDKKMATAMVLVAVVGDIYNEFDETFALELFDPSPRSSIQDSTGVGTIINDDPVPTVSISDSSGLEGDESAPGSAAFILTLSAPSGNPVEVAYAVVNGSATSTDLSPFSDVLIFDPGVSVATIIVPFLGDIMDEPDESFSVTLSGATNAMLADAAATGTLLDDDPEPTIAIGDVVVAEGNAGSKIARFTVQLSGASGMNVTVSYATVAGSAIPGADFTSQSGTLSFASSDGIRTIDVIIRGDQMFEPDESFFLELSGSVNARIADGRGEAKILNDDPVPSLSLPDTIGPEDRPPGFCPSVGECFNLEFFVVLSNPSYLDISVSFESRDNSALAGSDYDGVSGTLLIPAGSSSARVGIVAIDDSMEEPNIETFFLDLTDPHNATLTRSTAQGSIDDDEGLYLSPSDQFVCEGDVARLTVTLRGDYLTLVTVNYRTDPHQASGLNDHSGGSGRIIFLPGETQKSVELQTIADSEMEFREVFRMTLTGPVNARIEQSSGFIAIHDCF